MKPGTSVRPAASVTEAVGGQVVAPAVADPARGDAVAVEAHPRVGDGVEAGDEAGGVDDGRGAVLT